ncbi:MAG TPA: TadG family pilus assembly protein [Rhizomicrobium sp.]|nr:TadG family pilus assembly protein [Rhizomicrobium sp.]
MTMFRKVRRGFVRDETGAVSVFTAISIAMLLAIAAIVIDVGALFFARRSLQSVNDAAALAAVQAPSQAAAVAQSVFARNGYVGEQLTVTEGIYTPDESLSAEARFVPSETGVNAVRVGARIEKAGYFTDLFGLSRFIPLTTVSTATRIPAATFGAGTRLAELNGGLLNAILGRLWGSNISLTLVDYQALLTTNVDALTFLDQLAVDCHITGTYSELASADVTVGQVIQALVETTQAGAANGDTAAALVALKALALQIGGGATMRLSDIVDIAPLLPRSIGSIHEGKETGLGLNIMGLLSASARNAAANGTIDLGTAISVPVLNTSVSARLAAGNKMAQIADAQVGSTIHTGQIRMALTVTMTNVDLGVLVASVVLPIYLEVATGQAELTAMPCQSGGTLVDIDAASKLTTLGFGTVSDSALSDFSQPVTPVAAPIINATLLGIPIQVNVAGSAGVNGSGPDMLSFSQDDIDSGTIKSPGNADLTPFDDLSANMTFSTTILGQPGLLAGLLNTQLKALVAALAPVMRNVVTQLNTPVNSALTTLGVQLGTIDVRVFDAKCKTPTLVQ